MKCPTCEVPDHDACGFEGEFTQAVANCTCCAETARVILETFDLANGIDL